MPRDFFKILLYAPLILRLSEFDNLDKETTYWPGKKLPSYPVCLQGKANRLAKIGLFTNVVLEKYFTVYPLAEILYM